MTLTLMNAAKGWDEKIKAMPTRRAPLNLRKWSRFILGLSIGPLFLWGLYSLIKSGYERSLPPQPSPDFMQHTVGETLLEAFQVWKLNVKHHAPDLLGDCMAAKNNCAGLPFGGGVYGVFTARQRFDPVFFKAPSAASHTPSEPTGESISLPGDVLTLDGVTPPDWESVLATAGNRPPHTVVLKPSMEKVHTKRTKYLTHSETRLLAFAWRGMIAMGASPQSRPPEQKTHLTPKF